ncbi:DMT family transporter [uncultured Tateyamaria sp.]|uniref:DMT family transporter n=1 Tax=uncultured Tateyamaria sp. TaxID=455651 RepID=UPI00262F26F5|nr:DMT family transporter [uncultured Tateyamaria sp.]
MPLHRLSGPFVGVLTILCWSAYNVAAKHGIDTGMSPEALVFLRFSVPGIVAVPVLLILVARGRTLGIPVSRLLVLVLLGGPLFGLAAVSGYVHAPLSHGLLFAPVAVFLMSSLLGRLLLREPVTGRRMGAAALMFAALAILVGLDMRAVGTAWSQGAAFFVLAGAMWGAYIVLLRHWCIPMPEGAVGVAAGAALVALPVLGAAAVETLRTAPAAEIALQALMQGVVGGVISVVALIGVVRTLSVHTASLLPVFTPVVALGIAYVLFGAVPSGAEVAGVAIIAIGFVVSLGLRVPEGWSNRVSHAHR